jgi:hypothetical protein
MTLTSARLPLKLPPVAATSRRRRFNWLALLLILLVACTRREAPSPARPAPGASQAPGTGSTPDAMTLPKPGSPPLQISPWVRVQTDRTVFLRSPKNDLEKLRELLSTGMLLERCPREGKDAHVQTLSIDFIYLGQLPFKLSGSVEPVRVSPVEKGWVFSAALDAAAVEVPARDALCHALADSGASPIDKTSCERSEQFMLLETRAGPRRYLAAFGGINEPTPLAVLDLDALRAGRPAVTGGIETSGFTEMRQSLLQGGEVLLLAEGFTREGNRSGLGYSLITVSERGNVTRHLGIPANTSEPKNDVATIRNLQLKFQETPTGPVILADGEEIVQAVATGKVRFRTRVQQRITWDVVHRRFQITPQ